MLIGDTRTTKYWKINASVKSSLATMRGFLNSVEVMLHHILFTFSFFNDDDE